MIGNFAGEVTLDLIISTGLGTVVSGSSTVTKVDDIADAAKVIDKFDDIADGAKVIDKVDDITDAAKVVDKIDDDTDAAKVVDKIDDISGDAKNILAYEKYKDVLKTTQDANLLVDSLKDTEKLPDNFINKETAELAGWKPGKALENYSPGPQIGGDVFNNTPPVLPESSGRIWYEADVGLSGNISRAKQAGTRLIYSNDGLIYITTDHYIGKYLES